MNLTLDRISMYSHIMRPLSVTVGLSSIRLVIGILLIGIAVTTTAGELPSGKDPIKEEIRYAEGLKKMGLPDYAKIVLERIKDPSVAPRIKGMQVEALVAVGEFDKAKQIIAEARDQDSQEVWAMKLVYADGLYAWGKYPEARGVYNSFFEKYPDGPPPSLTDFFLNSSYRYAQMLMLMGDKKSGLEAYNKVLKVLPKMDAGKKHIRRQILSEMSELMIKLAEETSDKTKRQKYFKAIDEINNEILWVQDLWFGKAIVIMAHMKMIEDDIDGAQKLIDDYGAQLREIDKMLRKEEEETGEQLARLSPMAECRYLLGVIMQEEAEKLIAPEGDKGKIITLLVGKDLKGNKRSSGALQHFMNVFIRYPGTHWAPDAGIRAKKVEETLKGLGVEVEYKITEEQWEKVKQFQFQGAHALYNEQQFENAAESYIKVLNLFPEGETSVSALGELTRCYIELNNEFYVEMAMRYLAERFSRNTMLMPKAGDQLLAIAQMYGEHKMLEGEDAVYDLYFLHFTKHPRAPAMFFRFGELKFGIEDMESALGYYKQIEANYPNSPMYLPALNRIAGCYSKLGQYTNEIKTLGVYIAELEKKTKPGNELFSAKFRLGSAHRQLGPQHLQSAISRYSELIKLLRDGKEEYSAEDSESNRKVLEAAMYDRAHCYSMLTEPPDKVKEYKMAALRGFSELVEEFPKSSWAPAALSQIGTLWTVLDKPDEARKAFTKLKKDYRGSKEEQNALFMHGMNLLKLGMVKQAIEIFKEMFSEKGGEYSDAQILRAGNELFKAGKHEIALDAFNRVLASSKERIIREPSMLGKGQALIELEKYDEGAEILEQMLKNYSNSGYTVEVCFYLNRAYSELGMMESNEDKRFDLFNNAVKAMKRVRIFVKTDEKRAESDLRIGRTFELKAAAEEKFGSKKKALEYKNDAIAAYQVLMMTGNFSDQKVRPYIEDAFHECIPLLLETERWDDVVEDCDNYRELFQSGKYLLDVNKWRNETTIKKVMQHGPEQETEKEKEQEAAGGGSPGDNSGGGRQ